MHEKIVAKQCRFEASGAMAVLLGQIGGKLSNARNLTKIHVGVIAKTDLLHDVKYFGISKTLKDIARYKTASPIWEPTGQRACRVRSQCSTFLDLNILLTTLHNSIVLPRPAVVLTVYPCGPTERGRLICQEAHKTFSRNSQLADTITEVVVVDPAHTADGRSYPHLVPVKFLHDLHATTSIRFAGSLHSACFEEHKVDDGYLPPRDIELRRRHRIPHGYLCRGCLEVSPALGLLHLPNLKKLTISRIHLENGQKLVDFSTRHNATLKEMVIEQCMLTGEYASWEYVLSGLSTSGCMPEKLTLDGLFQHDKAYVEHKVEEGREWKRSAMFERDDDSGLGMVGGLEEFAVSNVSKKECNALYGDVRYTCVLFKTGIQRCDGLLSERSLYALCSRMHSWWELKVKSEWRMEAYHGLKSTLPTTFKKRIMRAATTVFTIFMAMLRKVSWTQRLLPVALLNHGSASDGHHADPSFT